MQSTQGGISGTYNEQYETLPTNTTPAPSGSATTTVRPKTTVTPNFENVATPVTFSNSPYNKAMEDYNKVQTPTPAATTTKSSTTTPSTTTTTNTSNNGAAQ